MLNGHRYTFDRTRGVWVSNPDPIDLDGAARAGEVILAAIAFTLTGLVVGVILVAVGVILETLARPAGWEGVAVGATVGIGLFGTVAAIVRPAIVRRRR